MLIMNIVPGKQLSEDVEIKHHYLVACVQDLFLYVIIIRGSVLQNQN